MRVVAWAFGLRFADAPLWLTQVSADSKGQVLALHGTATY